MKKILMPIDGTQRSMESAEFIAKNYDPGEVEIEAVTVREDYYAYAMTQVDRNKVVTETMPIFDKIDDILKGYKVNKTVLVGKSAGEEIVYFANDNNIDFIIMTKSTKRGIKNIIGSVASYVVRNSGHTVISIPEKEDVA